MLERLSQFVFYYPFFMALLWVVGALVFYLRHEWRRQELPALASFPQVTVLIPCHNEAGAIEQVVRTAARSAYPRFDIVVVDDASTDGSRDILARLAAELPELRIVLVDHNFGKAKALTIGALATQSEYLMSIDADALLDADAIRWMVHALEHNPQVGVVTGNPRVINRNTLVSRVQVGEFSAIVGMIKRTQRLIGRVYTISGVCACFRRRAVHDIGYWSSDTVTEDVDISWRLQLAGWSILYEPRAVCWILVPETLRGLWRQRLRWARGGMEALFAHWRALLRWRGRRMWPVMGELAVSTAWCYLVVAVIAGWLVSQVAPGWVPEPLRVPTLLPGWSGSLLAMVCLLQFSVGLAIDRRYEGSGLVRQLFWAIWYPALYWLITAGTSVVGLPIAIRHHGRTHHETWKSPDR